MEIIENKRVSNGIITRMGGINNKTLMYYSQELLIGRFPLIVLVAYIHYFETIKVGQISVGVGFNNHLMILMTHVISRAAVPTFFLISGYYFFSKSDFNIAIYKKKLRKRVHTIVLPYVLWFTLFILIITVIKLAGCLVKGNPLDVIFQLFHDNGWLNMYWCCNE